MPLQRFVTWQFTSDIRVHSWEVTGDMSESAKSHTAQVVAWQASV